MIIDFRARPNLPEYAHYLYPRLDAIEKRTAGVYQAFRPPVETLDEFVASLDGLGIDRVVFAARSRATDGDWQLTDEVVAAAAARHPDRITGFAGIDLRAPDLGDAVLRAVEGHGLRGVCFDPFQLGMHASDPHLDPAYAAAGRLGVPAVVTLGGLPGVPADLTCGDPVRLDEAAGRHPDTVIVGSHSGWPFTQAMIAVAWRRDNVFFENSFYHRAPGADLIVQAANEMIPHKVLYASAYPFAPLDVTLAEVGGLPFDDGVRERVMGGNAAALLGLT